MRKDRHGGIRLRAAALAPLALLPALALAFAGDEEARFSSRNASDSDYVCADLIVSAMQDAEESIDVAVAHFNSRRIADALIAIQRDRNEDEDASNDIRIRVLLDLGEYGDPRSRARELERAGITVRYKTYSLAFAQPRAQLLHHKVCIVDGDTVATGSYNWSDTAEHVNYENVVLLQGRRNRRTTRAFVAEMDRLWDMNRDVYDAFRRTLLARPGEDGYRDVVPIHFDTPYFDRIMALTRSEIQPLRARAARDGLFASRVFAASTFFDRRTRAPLAGALPEGSTFLPGEPTPGIVNTLGGATGTEPPR